MMPAAFTAAPRIELFDKEVTSSNNGQCAWALKTYCCVLVLIIVSFATAAVGLWYFEEIYPLKPLLPTEIVPTVLTPSVHLHTLSPRDSRHRQKYHNNTLMIVMNATHAIFNKSNCWICTHLPQHGNKGLGWYIHPLPLTTSCYASLRALFFGRWNDSISGNFDGTNLNEFERRELTPLGCSLFANRSRPNIASIRPSDKLSFPFQNLVSFKMAPIGNKDAMPPSYSVNHNPDSVPFCVQRNGTRPMGDFEPCIHIVNLTGENRPLYVGGPVYFVCGNLAFPWLPKDWQGTCYLGILLPGVFIASTLEVSKARPRRDSDGDTPGQVFGDIAKSVVPFWGQIVNSENIRGLARVLEKTINRTTDILYNMTLEQKAIRLVALQNRMALDVILAERGGVCKLVGSACCVFVPDSSPTIFKAIQNLHTLSSEVHIPVGDWSLSTWFWDSLRSWGWKVLSVILGILGTLLFLCCCFQCLPSICGMMGGCCAQVVSAIGRKIYTSKTASKEFMLQEVLTNDLMAIDISDNDAEPMDDNAFKYFQKY